MLSQDFIHYDGAAL